jgi:hypothetical protein
MKPVPKSKISHQLPGQQYDFFVIASAEARLDVAEAKMHVTYVDNAPIAEFIRRKLGDLKTDKEFQAFYP